jgi:hypothetical protein
LFEVSRSQRRSARFKPGKHRVNKLLLGHNIDCTLAPRHPVANALNEFAASFIVTGLSPAENDNRLIARDTGFPLSEFIDGRAGAASKCGKRSKQDATNGSATTSINEFDQAPAPDK